ncbi:virginiamycin B lyase family protein [Curvibacter gracilis]|uniref:virginiamycin B lyase family protein n=1 Tax=Curvibacter gracilis TaxID=230310 RepID=UPI0012F966C0|nr:hypothetical protein [Curvibacter gracilis]
MLPAQCTAPWQSVVTGHRRKPRPLSRTHRLGDCAGRGLVWLLCLFSSWASAQITGLTRYPVGPDTLPQEIVAGPDGQMWFTQRQLVGSTTSVVQLGLDGTTRGTYQTAAWAAVPSRLGAGTDGNIWVTVWDGEAIRVAPDGTQARFSAPASVVGYAGWATGITPGPDGQMWMVLQGGVARIAPDGSMAAYPIASSSYFGLNGSIVTGPDGQLWIADGGTARIIRLDPKTGNSQSYPLPDPSSYPAGLTAGPDGQVWFTVPTAQQIGRIHPVDGSLQFFTPPTYAPASITVGPDGNLWYVTAQYNGQNVVGRITPQGRITEYPVLKGSKGSSITAGPDGKLWLTEELIDPVAGGVSTGNIVTFALPARVTGLATGPGGTVTPASQDLRMGVSATLTLSPDTGYLVDTVEADRCGPLGLSEPGTVSTGVLSSDCTVSARFTAPQCSASPARGFAGAPASLLCSGLPAVGALDIPGATCSDTVDGQATCLGTIGQTDGSGSARDALGHAVALPALLSPVAPAVCQARPAAGFANTPVALRCTGLPPAASLSVAGAQCAPPEPDGSVLCQGLLMGGDQSLPDAVTTLDDGSEARQPIGFETLPGPTCQAEPNPARSGTPISIQCSDVPAGSVATLANGVCVVGSDGQATCQGTAGLGADELGLNPTLSFELNGGTARIVTPLALLNAPPSPADPLTPVPTLGTTGLGALIGLLLLGARRQRQRGR